MKPHRATEKRSKNRRWLSDWLYRGGGTGDKRFEEGSLEQKQLSYDGAKLLPSLMLLVRYSSPLSTSIEFFCCPVRGYGDRAPFAGLDASISCPQCVHVELCRRGCENTRQEVLHFGVKYQRDRD